jgi:hypothetical protein
MREIKLKMRTNAVPIDLSEAEYRADNLVTCKEFMTALKTETNGGKMNRRNREPSSQLYHRILPRTLSFHKVLVSVPYEAEF